MIDEQFLRLRSVECGECWEWTHSYTSSGIPLLSRADGGKMVRAQAVIDILGRTMPKGMIAASRCRNRRCVRPDHIEVISRAKLLERSRENTNEALRHAKIAKARRAQSKVLTEEVARLIASSDETLGVLAKRHNIHPTMAQKIKSGKAWAPVSPFAGLFTGLVAANEGRKRA